MWATAELTERTRSHLGIGKRKKTERTKGREGDEKNETKPNLIKAEGPMVTNTAKSKTEFGHAGCSH